MIGSFNSCFNFGQQSHDSCCRFEFASEHGVMLIDEVSGYPVF